MASFDSVDKDGSNALEPREVMPICVELLGNLDPSMPPLTQEQCMIFLFKIFDQNSDGKIDRGEWVYVIEYVCACHAIEAVTPKSKVTAEMRKQLPEELLMQLASPAFITSCMASFGTSYGMWFTGTHRERSDRT